MLEIIFACSITPALGGFLAASLGAPLLVLGLIAGALDVLGLIGIVSALSSESSGSGGLGVFVFSGLFMLAGVSLELGSILGHYLR